nr:Maf family nucleotide pyrophosphatase [Xanthovirga aplysinae]
MILASASPRRGQILLDAGYDFIVKTSPIDESYPTDTPLRAVAQYLAKKKAKAFTQPLNDEIIITADTVVLIEDQILGKPLNREEAIRMLNMLSGRTHQVITGVCLRAFEKEISFDDTTVVKFKELKEEEIEYYVDHYHPFDKAGAYGIQDWIGMIGIEKIEGSFFTVMGFPIHNFYEHLKEFQFPPQN